MKLHRMQGCSSVSRKPFAAVHSRRGTVEKACAFCHRPIRTPVCDTVLTVRPLPLVSVQRRRRDDGRHSGWTAFRHFPTWLARLGTAAAVLRSILRSMRMWLWMWLWLWARRNSNWTGRLGICTLFHFGAAVTGGDAHGRGGRAELRSAVQCSAVSEKALD